MGERTKFILKVTRRLPREGEFCHGEEPDSAGTEPGIGHLEVRGKRKTGKGFPTHQSTPLSPTPKSVDPQQPAPYDGLPSPSIPSNPPRTMDFQVRRSPATCPVRWTSKSVDPQQPAPVRWTSKSVEPQPSAHVRWTSKSVDISRWDRRTWKSIVWAGVRGGGTGRGRSKKELRNW